MENKLRTLLSVKVALTIAMVSLVLVAATIYYYYTSTVTVSVEAPKINWVTGGDVAATISGNKSYCTVSISKLQPNATTVYTSALKFTVVAAGTIKLQIASVTDSNSIIWGMRFYIYKSGASDKNLTLVDGGQVTVGSTDGGGPVAQVGFYQTGANTNYGTLIGSLPAGSTGFAATTTTYIIVLEAMGEETCQTTESATINLRLIWYA
jgi:hypothetical protein